MEQRSLPMLLSPLTQSMLSLPILTSEARVLVCDPCDWGSNISTFLNLQLHLLTLQLEFCIMCQDGGELYRCDDCLRVMCTRCVFSASAAIG
ncbi:hypothetical protein PAXRUDRAFT_276459 [Paxillus rubicundulus Ve08.2h10]|uniref:Uncharacterized protein n=1 Tax=Paxillus rubicundulus Ve08.2h10 TaxID=930991 RepID=A0A0D0D791_9AGAM|nr:hypothetical protein PAXRUDRAFT_276459 [Paxillus rubicundulus Ve08.2h10]